MRIFLAFPIHVLLEQLAGAAETKGPVQKGSTTDMFLWTASDRHMTAAWHFSRKKERSGISHKRVSLFLFALGTLHFFASSTIRIALLAAVNAPHLASVIFFFFFFFSFLNLPSPSFSSSTIALSMASADPLVEGENLSSNSLLANLLLFSAISAYLLPFFRPEERSLTFSPRCVSFLSVALSPFLMPRAILSSASCRRHLLVLPARSRSRPMKGTSARREAAYRVLRQRYWRRKTREVVILFIHLFYNSFCEE